MSARPAGATLLKRALFHSGLLALARLARQRVRGVVLRYHALTDGAGRCSTRRRTSACRSRPSGSRWRS